MMLHLLKDKQIAPVLIVLPLFLLFSTLISPGFATFGDSGGLSNLTIGLIIAIFGIGRLIADFFTSPMADIRGERFVLVVSSGLVAVASFVMAIDVSDTSMLVGRAIQGIGSGMFMTAALIFVARVASPADRANAFALYQTSILIGAIIGPAVGGVIIAFAGIAGVLMTIGVMSLMVTAVVLTLFDRGGPIEQAGTGKTSHFIALKEFSSLERPLVLSALAVNFMLFLTRTTVLWFIVPTILHRNLGAGPMTIGLLLGICAVANMAGSIVSGKIVRTYGSERTLVVSSLACGLGIATCQAQLSIAGMVAPLSLLGVGTGLLGTSVSTLVIERWPAFNISTMMASMRTSGDVGYLTGPILIGLSLDYNVIDPAMSLVVIGVAVALTIVPWITTTTPSTNLGGKEP